MTGYRAYPVRPELARYVRRVWSFSTFMPSPGQIDSIVPDGCPELVVHLTAPPLEIGAQDVEHAQSPIVFAGQITGPLRLKTSGIADFIAVRFKPAGARAVMRMPMQDVTDRRAGCEALGWTGDGHLVERLREAASDSSRAALLQDWLVGQIAGDAQYRDAAIEVCVDELERGSLSMSRLMARTGLSARQIERRFLASVGISPRLFAGIVRFRRMQNLATRGSSWAARATAAGYYDQAQMIRDFRRFAGTTPAAFAAEASGLAAALA